MPTLFVDDRDSAVHYSSGWESAGTAPEEYNGTTSYASLPGQTATLIFRGTMVAVYGTIGAALSATTIPPQTSYSVDGGDPVIYTETMTSSLQYRQLFYQSLQLSDSQHKLVITNLLDAPRFFLDYFIVTTADTPTSASSGTALLAPSGSAALADTASHNRKVVVGGTICAVVGCVLLLLAVVLVLRRRHKAPRSEGAISRFLEPTIYGQPAKVSHNHTRTRVQDAYRQNAVVPTVQPASTNSNPNGQRHSETQPSSPPAYVSTPPTYRW